VTTSWRVDARRNQPRRDEEVRVDDVRSLCAADAPRELDVAALAAGAMIEHGKFDLVTAFTQRALHLLHEDPEVRVVQARVHL
jgi:hypothetical protein